jgi:hypothetical protein
MNRQIIALIGAIAFAACALPAAAAVVELTDGQRLEGTFKHATSESVTLEIAGNALVVDLKNVRAIYFAPAATPATTRDPAFTEPLRALKAVNSATTVGVSHHQYGPRVQEAKIALDRYLGTPISGDEGIRAALREAMEYHIAANMTWDARLRGRDGRTHSVFERLAPTLRPLVDRCSELKQALQQVKVTESSSDYSLGYTASVVGMQALWQCASRRVNEAEQLVGPQK